MSMNIDKLRELLLDLTEEALKATMLHSLDKATCDKVINAQNFIIDTLNLLRDVGHREDAARLKVRVEEATKQGEAVLELAAKNRRVDV